MMSEDGWKVSITSKIGDHQATVHGDSEEEAVGRLENLANMLDNLHGALSALDGRPATDVVQKEKQWGGRSQGGRGYPDKSGGNSGGGNWGAKKPAGGGSWAKGAGSEPVVMPAEVPEMYRTCPTHNAPMEYKEAGANKATGKPFSARVVCGTFGCDSIKWQGKDGSWD